jgi:hypothetical protein
MSGMNPYDDELDVMPVSEGDLDEVVSLWTEAFNFMKDCMADNPKLNAFYQGAGFVFKGKVNGNGWSAHLYEKELL